MLFIILLQRFLHSLYTQFTAILGRKKKVIENSYQGQKAFLVSAIRDTGLPDPDSDLSKEISLRGYKGRRLSH